MTAHAQTSYEPVLLRDAGELPWDMVSLHDAFDLKAAAFKVLCRLRFHLRRYGQLPTGMTSLAAIGHVGARSFERMAPDLALHFGRDADGRWTDRAILAARGRSAVTPARELPAVDPELSALRRELGSRGGKARWQKPHQPLQLVSGGREDTTPEMANASGSVAKPAETMANATGRRDGKRDGKRGRFAIGVCYRFAIVWYGPGLGRSESAS